MLNPQMKSRGLYELMRRQAQELEQHQEEKTKAQIEADAGQAASRS
jgi:hypothetical protein